MCITLLVVSIFIKLIELFIRRLDFSTFTISRLASWLDMSTIQRERRGYSGAERTNIKEHSNQNIHNSEWFHKSYQRYHIINTMEATFEQRELLNVQRTQKINIFIFHVFFGTLSLESWHGVGVCTNRNSLTHLHATLIFMLRECFSWMFQLNNRSSSQQTKNLKKYSCENECSLQKLYLKFITTQPRDDLQRVKKIKGKTSLIQLQRANLCLKLYIIRVSEGGEEEVGAAHWTAA